MIADPIKPIYTKNMYDIKKYYQLNPNLIQHSAGTAWSKRLTLTSLSKGISTLVKVIGKNDNPILWDVLCSFLLILINPNLCHNNVIWHHAGLRVYLVCCNCCQLQRKTVNLSLYFHWCIAILHFCP